jgi:hypothetical protein
MNEAQAADPLHSAQNGNPEEMTWTKARPRLSFRAKLPLSAERKTLTADIAV